MKRYVLFFIFCISLVETSWSQLLTDSLVIYYPFNTNLNFQTVDESVNDNKGSLLGSPVPAEDRQGNPNSAVYFDGENIY